MKIDNLDRMTKGWIAGDFEPSVLKTKDLEFGVKTYKKGEHESWHYHKVATEITVIVSGEASMNGKTYKAGDIIVLAPGDGTDFKCLSDVTTAILKVPSLIGDKYTERPEDD